MAGGQKNIRSRVLFDKGKNNLVLFGQLDALIYLWRRLSA